MSVEYDKEYQWRLIYPDNSIHEFLGTHADMTGAIGRRWLLDKAEPRIFYRSDIESSFQELVTIKYNDPH